MHDGRVEARSAGPGHGSEFIVELPARSGAIDVSEPPAAPPGLPLRRILVVDDNGDAADMLASHLAALGATVSVINNGQGAIDRLASFRPDTVLLDIGMPGMSGYEVARRIRTMPGHEQTLLIALTGWGQQEDYERSRAAGIDYHLVKPLDMYRLRQMLIDSTPNDAR
jgi:CheY-like chemotaxis protein